MTTRRALWPALVAMAVAGPAAVVASAVTLAALARAAGWTGWTPWLLPATVDVAGFACGWYWLRPAAPQRAQAFGRRAFVALTAGSIVGNGVGHLVTTGRVQPSAVLILVVGAVPAAVLVVLGHLAALTVTEPAGEAAPEAGPAPVVEAPSFSGVSPDPAPAARPETPARKAAPKPPARRERPPTDGVDREAEALRYAAQVRATDPGHRFTGYELGKHFRASQVKCGNTAAEGLAAMLNGARVEDDEDAGERVA